MKHLIYGLFNLKSSNNIQYIGRSSSGMKRPISHYDMSFKKNNNGKYISNFYVNRWIRKNGKYEIKIIEKLPNDIVNKNEINDWLNETEIKYITQYKEAGHKLVNTTNGGAGTLGLKVWLGKKHSEETRKKMSNSGKGKNNGFYGKKHSEESRKKMKGIRPNFKHSDKVKELLSNKFSKQVICLNDNKIFKSIKKASEYYNVDKNSISRVCRKLQKQTNGGYKFIYKNEEEIWKVYKKRSDETKNKISKSLSKIIVCMTDGIKFNSLKIAAKHYLLPASSISLSCRLNKKVGNADFRYY